MKYKKYASNTALAVVLGIALAVCMLIRTFVPMAVLPRLDIPNMVLLSMIALLAAVGGVVFAVTAWLFASCQERISSGPAAKAAPVLSALCLYLASQCFAGIL